MVFQRLQLTNFRGFESLDLTFEPDLTVLVGVNGCGKTSIIDAMLIGLGFEGWRPPDIHAGAVSARVRAETSDSARDAFVEIGNSSHFVRPTSDNASHILTFVYGTHRGTQDDTPGSLALRAWTPDDARMMGFRSVSYIDFFKWLRATEDEENEQIRHGQGSEDPMLRTVRDAIHRLFPGYSKLRIRRKGAMGDHRPRLTVEKDGEILLFDVLSEGERTSIAMIADIARRLALAHPETENALEQPCLLVIDEFEQHLHPQWQRELPRRMREVFPGAQMVLTTHSPIVVSELLPRQIRALQGFRLLEGAHREGQDVNEILETLFGTPSRKRETQALIEATREAIDDEDRDEADAKLEQLTQQLGSDDPEVVRLTTIHRMLGAIDHEAVPEG